MQEVANELGSGQTIRNYNGTRGHGFLSSLIIIGTVSKMTLPPARLLSPPAGMM